MKDFKIVSARPGAGGNMAFPVEGNVPLLPKHVSKQLFFSEEKAEETGYVVFAERRYFGTDYTGFYQANSLYDAMGLGPQIREKFKEAGNEPVSRPVFGPLIPMAVNDGQATVLTQPGETILRQIGKEPTVEALMALVEETRENDSRVLSGDTWKPERRGQPFSLNL